jgi:hypothetical protein
MSIIVVTSEVNIFFFLIVFGGTEVLIILHFPLPPLRGQPTVKCHPRWQPISGLAVHCRLVRLLDSNPGLEFYNLVSLPMSHHCSQMSNHCSQWATTAPNEPPLLPDEPPLLPSEHVLRGQELNFICCKYIFSYILGFLKNILFYDEILVAYTSVCNM